MKRTSLKAIHLTIAATLLAGVASAEAAKFKLKIATIAPAGTTFHRQLEALGAEWQKAPGGGVSINIYPGGSQGGEETIVRRMQYGQLDGAMLSAVGLGKIDDSVTALQLMPLVFKNWEEVDHVREKLGPQLEGILEKKNYVVLFWADAGWVRYFSTKPIPSMNAMQSMRVFATAGSPKALELYKDYYVPVVLETENILLGLRNGMIDAVPVPPFLANATQVATEADYMLDMKWVPVVGAMVVTKRQWDRMPEETRQFILKTSRETGKAIREASRKEDDEAIEAMKAKQGLKVIPFEGGLKSEWEAAAEKNLPEIRGDVVPAGMFDEVMKTLKEFRARN